ncbi:MAG: hypothetical protein ISQ65_01995 [Pseudomonadales bacterium]|nr:hypothetical protein [Pseudomonadales bacterium]
MIKRVCNGLLICLVVLGSGCAIPHQEPPRQILDPEEGLTEGFIGLTETQARVLARSRNLPFRVVQRDGKDLAVTFDFRRGRINAEVRDNVVVAYSVEGEQSKPAAKANSEGEILLVPGTDRMDPSCLTFFDGCNRCVRTEPGAPAACTKMACAEYAPAQCLDKKKAPSS